MTAYFLLRCWLSSGALCVHLSQTIKVCLLIDMTVNQTPEKLYIMTFLIGNLHKISELAA